MVQVSTGQGHQAGAEFTDLAAVGLEKQLSGADDDGFIDIELDDVNDRSNEPAAHRDDPASPGNWGGSKHPVPFTHVDEALNASATGCAGICMLVVCMLMYLADMAVSYVVIGWYFGYCNWHVGLLALVKCAFSDVSMYYAGMLLQNQALFFWPTTLKLVVLTPLFELQWLVRLWRNWKGDGTNNDHHTQFMHAFGACMCLFRACVFSVPQALLLIIARAVLDAGRDAPPDGYFITAISIHAGFCALSMVYAAQAALSRTAGPRVSCMGIPPPDTSKWGYLALMLVFAVGAYVIAIVVGLATNDDSCA
ncbi:hypothetical protein DIPPA_10458 [Diplonema papillatum]|nr:hypothetical protein DIPPA_10458 [Diplonema papillatum]